MSKNIFRIFNPGGPKQDPVEKRRGQLRRAQQNYRDRKDKYAASLEKELARTRAREANLTRKVEQLQSTVKVFAGLLSFHAIDIPADIWTEDENDMADQTMVNIPEASPFSPSNQVQLRGRKAETPVSSPEDLYRVRGNESAASTPQWASSSGYPAQQESLVLLNDQDHPLHSADSWTEVSQASMHYQNPNKRLRDVDAVTVGMEFVLMLERPCLGHIHGDPNKPDEPGGHQLTASAHLLSISPSLPSNEPTPSFQEAPSAILNCLLNLSPGLCPGGEVTPIQAWNYIRCQPHFPSLDVTNLWALLEGLREAVKCHGFGAVVQWAFFENLVQNMFMLQRGRGSS